MIAKNFSENYGGFKIAEIPIMQIMKEQLEEKSLANEMLNIIDVITLNLIKAEKSLNFLKHKFIEDFGQENLEN